MPSPFPGMDPYLEHPARWPDLHHELISQIRAELNQQLRPRYFARIEERVYISDENDPARALFVPDIQIAEGDRLAPRRLPEAASSVGVIEPIEVTTFLDDEIHEARIEVIDADSRNVITVIEVLSPTNKVRSSRGQKSYQKKRREIMLSSSHLVEIDLLRAGVRIFIPDPIPPHDYLVHVTRAKPDGTRRGTVWPIPIATRLPAIPIPLRGGDPDASVDLQSTLEIAYSRGAYELIIDYTRDPVPSLTPEQAEWAKSVLATKV